MTHWLSGWFSWTRRQGVASKEQQEGWREFSEKFVREILLPEFGAERIRRKEEWSTQARSSCVTLKNWRQQSCGSWWERCNGGRRKKRWRKGYLSNVPLPHMPLQVPTIISIQAFLIWPFISYRKPQSWQSLKKIVKVLKRQEGFPIKVGCSSLENPGLRTPDHTLENPEGQRRGTGNLPSTPNLVPKSTL